MDFHKWGEVVGGSPRKNKGEKGVFPQSDEKATTGKIFFKHPEEFIGLFEKASEIEGMYFSTLSPQCVNTVEKITSLDFLS